MATTTFVVFLLFVYLSILGALNWGLVSVFHVDLVQILSMKNKKVAQTLYVTIALSAIVAFVLSFAVLSEEHYVPPEEEDPRLR